MSENWLHAVLGVTSQSCAQLVPGNDWYQKKKPDAVDGIRDVLLRVPVSHRSHPTKAKTKTLFCEVTTAPLPAYRVGARNPHACQPAAPHEKRTGADRHVRTVRQALSEDRPNRAVSPAQRTCSACFIRQVSGSLAVFLLWSFLCQFCFDCLHDLL